MKEILRLGLVLMVICALSGALLAGVRSITGPIIEKRRQADFENTLRKVILGAERFERTDRDGHAFYAGIVGESPVGYATLVAVEGYGGPIQVLVGIDGKSRVINTVVTSGRETPGLGSRVQRTEFTDRFTGKTPADPITIGVDIEGVTGATISSQAVARAVKQAAGDLQAAFLGTAGGGIDLARVPDGIYTGTGQGFGGKIQVAVHVADQRIVKVAVLSHKESPGIADRALTGVPAIIVARQSINVEEVSGATWSSRGIIEAVHDALREFVAKPATTPP